MTNEDPNISGPELLRLHDTRFPDWLQEYVENNEVDGKIKNLAFRPHGRAKYYKGYFINGFKFHTVEHGESRTTMNSGVWTLGSSRENDVMDYYGLLEEVLELDYHGDSIVLFKCAWYDTSTSRGIRDHHGFNLTEINRKTKLKSNDLFVLAHQAQQFCYIEFPKKPKRGDRGDRDWVAVCKVKARSRIVVNLLNDNEDDELRADSPLQERVTSTPTNNDLMDELDDINILLDKNANAEEVDPSELRHSTHVENEEDEEDEVYEEAFGDLFSDEEPENDLDDMEHEYSSDYDSSEHDE